MKNNYYILINIFLADYILNSLNAQSTEKVTLDSLSITQEEWEIATVQQEINEPKKLEMSEYEKEVLFLFNDYSFTKLQSQSDLFDLTYEYPNDNWNEYFEYYSPNLTLIIFSNNTYEEVRERLKVIWDLENFKINEIDNFGDESFYINVADNFDDGDIRLVFTKEWKSFWLKISKNEYNNVKQILENL